LEGKQRIDRWIWHARVVKTRKLAASLVASGHVRVNGKRVDSPGHVITADDVLTIALPSIVRVLRVIEIADRRGNAKNAKQLYEELSSKVVKK
jgi:ribosome-associated heat shock protein Hsp15